MSNVLSEEKKQQAVALGRLGWSLRRIQKAIGVRRETVSAYLKAAGVAMRAPRGQFIPAKPASREDGVITDPHMRKTGQPGSIWWPTSMLATSSVISSKGCSSSYLQRPN